MGAMASQITSLTDCLLKRLFRRRLKKTQKLRVTGLCAGNSPVTGEFPAQRASNAENVSIWWRHHERLWYDYQIQAIFCGMILSTPLLNNILPCYNDTMNKYVKRFAGYLVTDKFFFVLVACFIHILTKMFYIEIYFCCVVNFVLYAVGDWSSQDKNTSSI